MASDQDNSVIKVQALGRPFGLGMLYDCRSDKLLPGITLWNKEKLDKDMTITPKATLVTKLSASDKFSSKADLLDIDASLKLSFLAGAISVSGSAKYLDDKKSSSHHERVSMSYNCTTKFEQLNMGTLATENIDYPNIFSNHLATHVVAGIHYGANVILSFEMHNDSNDSKRHVGGAVEVLVKSIPSFSIEGKASVDLNEEQKEISKSLNVTFYGDVRPKYNPTTFLEAIQLYKEMNELVGENGQPLTIWLYPLEMLDSKAAKLARDISVSLTLDIEQIFEGFQEISMRCNDLQRNSIYSKLLSLEKQLEMFKSLVKQEQLVFQKKLQPILPKIKGGFEAESVLTDILLELNKSPFTYEKLEEWIKEREHQLEVITNYYEFIKGIKFISSRELKAKIMNPKYVHIICFMLQIPVADEQMAAMKAYSEERDPDFKNQETVDGKESTQSMQTRQSVKLFKEFFDANELEKGNDTLFCISEMSTTSQELTGSIYQYTSGSLISTDFKPPSAPEKLDIVKINDDSILLKWKPSIPGTEEMRKYELVYQEFPEGAANNKTIDNSSTEYLLSPLSSATAYMIRCRCRVPSGVSPYCELPDPVHTLPKKNWCPSTINSLKDQVINSTVEVWAFLERNDEMYSAEITTDEGSLLLKSLSKRAAPEHAITVPYHAVRALISDRNVTVFLSIQLPHSAQLNLVRIRLEGNADRTRQFQLMCSGECGPSYANTCFHEQETDGIWGGARNDGEVGALLDFKMGPRNDTAVVEGTVVSFYMFPVERRPTHFKIFMNGQRQSADMSPIGKVISGMTTIKEAHNVSNITNVRIVDCGIVLQD